MRAGGRIFAMDSRESNPEWQDPSLAVGYVNGLRDLVFVVNCQARILEGNAAFFDFLGAERAACLGQLLRDCLSGKGKYDSFLHCVERMAAAHEEGRDFVIIGDSVGNLQTTLLTAVKLKRMDGAPLVAIRVEDVSEMMRERAESEAEKIAVQGRAEALERLNEELEGFSYSVAHDLRAPLRFIDKFAYLLLEKHSTTLSPEGLQYAEHIRAGTRQMTQLIEDLLHFSRATGQELRRERFDLTALAREVIQEAELDIEDREVHIDLGDLGECHADPALLRQVLANLVWNAIKFTRPRKRAEISIRHSTVDGQQTYVVSDNGVGFDASAADRLFTVFQRFHQPDDFEGSGVGLAVVSRIVDRHGGEVWAESQVGCGAAFYFTLGRGVQAVGSE